MISITPPVECDTPPLSKGCRKCFRSRSAVSSGVFDVEARSAISSDVFDVEARSAISSDVFDVEVCSAISSGGFDGGRGSKFDRVGVEIRQGGVESKFF